MKLKSVCIVTTLILGATLLALSCSEQQQLTSTSPSLTPIPAPASSTGTPDPSPNPTVAPPAPTECEQIQLKRSSIKTETDCQKGVRFYAEASGADYFNIHLGGLNNGPILGPNEPNAWSKWYKLDAGSYTYTLAAEAKVDGKVIQCDHHNNEFVIPTCKVDPKCPKDAYLDIDVNQRQLDVSVIVDPCPKYSYWTYTATSNLPIVELSLPPGCSPSDPMSGTCQFSVPSKGPSSHIISGKAYRDDPKMLCAQDFETMVVEPCKECRACENYKMTVYKKGNGDVFIGDPPTGMYYTINGGGHYQNGQIVPAPTPDCGDTARIVVNLYDEHCSKLQWCEKWTFDYEGECFCEDLDLTEGCYSGNIDTVAHFKNYFQIPGDYCINRTHRIGSKRFSCILSPYSAKWAVVKGGPQFRLYQDVKKWDRLCTYCPAGASEANCKKPDISHISFFDCCPKD